MYYDRRNQPMSKVTKEAFHYRVLPFIYLSHSQRDFSIKTRIYILRQPRCFALKQGERISSSTSVTKFLFRIILPNNIIRNKILCWRYITFYTIVMKFIECIASSTYLRMNDDNSLYSYSTEKCTWQNREIVF